MKRQVLLAGAATLVTLLLSGWALAQTMGPAPFGWGEGPGAMDPDGMGPGGMHGMRHGMGHGLHGQMGPALQGQMGPGMRGRMGPGMMGMGPGMMGMSHGSATASEHNDIRALFSDHDRIKRTVTNLPDGIRTVTESDDPRLAQVIKRHVAEMGKRVVEGRDPGLPIETPALHAIFRDKDKIKSAYEVTEKGVVVVQTSDDAGAVKALQTHAAEVSDLARRGMTAAHEAMMKNGGMMRQGMRGPMGGPQHRH
jgi:hypothetical protein